MKHFEIIEATKNNMSDLTDRLRDYWAKNHGVSFYVADGNGNGRRYANLDRGTNSVDVLKSTKVDFDKDWEREQAAGEYGTYKGEKPDVVRYLSEVLSLALAAQSRAQNLGLPSLKSYNEIHKHPLCRFVVVINDVDYWMAESGGDVSGIIKDLYEYAEQLDLRVVLTYK